MKNFTICYFLEFHLAVKIDLVGVVCYFKHVFHLLCDKSVTQAVVNDLFLSLNKGNIPVLALLDFSSAFDTIDHPILVHRLHTDFGFTDTVLQWFSSYLTDRTHYISLSNHCSAFNHVHSDVPQGSVLGPILFTMYIKPLSAIIDSHSIIHHSFADDLQLQMSAPPDRISELLHSMQSLISDVKAWATANMLKLNDNKIELMLVTSKRTKHLHNLPTSITIGNTQIPFKQPVKNLGFTLDCHLTMNAHVSNIARTCYFELRRLTSIRRFLRSTTTATLVSAFVLSRIDYCNSLLFSSTHDVTSHMQRIQNYAARVILRLPKSSSITIHLKSLHWLPVKVRSTYKIAFCATTATAVLHHHMSLACCIESHCTPATLAPAHTPCLFSIDLPTVRHHLVIVHFLLLLLLSGTLFQMMSGVPHHCHHLSLV